MEESPGGYINSERDVVKITTPIPYPTSPTTLPSHSEPLYSFTMPTVRNGTVLYVAKPEKHIDPDIHLKYVEREIDLDNVPLNGGALLKSLYLSSDPYIRYRMQDPDVEQFCPPILLGDPYV